MNFQNETFKFNENGYKKYCRVCMESSPKYNFQDLLKIESENERLTYLECFELVTNLSINKELNTSQSLCSHCSLDLKNAFIFLRKAQRAEKLMCESIEILDDDALNEIIEETISDDGSVIESDISPSSIADEVSDIEIIEESNDKNENNVKNEVQQSIIEPMTPDEHLKINNQIVKCGECSYKCKGSMLPEHLRREHGLESKFNCHICSKAYKSSNLLSTHLSYHRRKKTRNQSDACTICGKTFATSYYLRQHKLVHDDEREKLPCDQCDKVYITRNALESHKRIHSGQTLKCSECNKLFSKEYELKIHMRFHTKNYPFKCSICERKFAIKGHLRSHIRWQHQRLKVQCEDCGKLFTSTEALQEHSYTHGKEMPFPCVYCHKSYPSKQKYKVHLAMIHLLEFDEKEHVRSLSTPKTKSRRKNVTLVQADGVIKDVEVQSKENDIIEEMLVEIS